MFQCFFHLWLFCQASKHERAKKSPTFKDLDFLELVPDGFHLEPETYTALMSTIERDCRVLESFDIMDYSLLLAVHNLDEAKRENDKSEVAREHEKKRSFQPNITKLVAHSTPMESIQAYFFFYYLFAVKFLPILYIKSPGWLLWGGRYCHRWENARRHPCQEQRWGETSDLCWDHRHLTILSAG